MATWNLVGLGSGIDLLPDGTKPLPGPEWTNVNLTSRRFSDNHLRVISQETPQSSIAKISLKIAHLKFHSNLPGVNEVIVQSGILIRPITTRYCIYFIDTYRWYFMKFPFFSQTELLFRRNEEYPGRVDCGTRDDWCRHPLWLWLWEGTGSHPQHTRWGD